MDNTVQINLQDSKGTVFDVDRIDVIALAQEIVDRNTKLRESESLLRWRVEGEADETDGTVEFAKVLPLLKMLTTACGVLELPIFVMVSTGHRFGMRHAIVATETVVEGQSPEVFNLIKNFFLKKDIHPLHLKKILEEQIGPEADLPEAEESESEKETF